MATITHLSGAAILAMRALVNLSVLSEPIPNADLARRLKASPPSLSKALQRLCRMGIVKSSRGPHGGYKINPRMHLLSALAVASAIDGKLSDPKLDGSRLSQMLLKLEEQARETMRAYTIEFLAGS